MYNPFEAQLSTTLLLVYKPRYFNEIHMNFYKIHISVILVLTTKLVECYEYSLKSLSFKCTYMAIQCNKICYNIILYVYRSY